MFGDSMPTVLEEGAQRETGENSRMASFMGAFAICDLVKTTLGPKGMDKILQPMGGGAPQPAHGPRARGRARGNV